MGVARRDIRFETGGGRSPVSRSGGCQCGAVRYELSGELGPLINCHCRFCRRAHGAAFATSMPITTSHLSMRSGEADVKQYRQRYFCGVCGARLWNRLDDYPEVTVLMAATLDDEPTDEPVMHLNLESKAPWYTIRDDARGYEGFPPNVDRALQPIDED